MKHQQTFEWCTPQRDGRRRFIKPFFDFGPTRAAKGRQRSSLVCWHARRASGELQLPLTNLSVTKSLISTCKVVDGTVLSTSSRSRQRCTKASTCANTLEGSKFQDLPSAIILPLPGLSASPRLPADRNTCVVMSDCLAAGSAKYILAREVLREVVFFTSDSRSV